MKKAAAFFGGAVIGALLAGAYGLDFFPHVRASYLKLRHSLRQVEQLQVAQRDVIAQRDVARSEHQTALKAATDRQAELLAVRRDLEGRQDALNQHQVDIERLTQTLSLSQKETESARCETLSARQETQLLVRRLTSSRRDKYELLCTVFRVPRGDGEAWLAAEYLRSEAPEELKRGFIVHLRNYNPTILMALPGTAVAQAPGVPSPRGGAVKPASFRGEVRLDAVKYNE